MSNEKKKSLKTFALRSIQWFSIHRNLASIFYLESSLNSILFHIKNNQNGHGIQSNTLCSLLLFWASCSRIKGKEKKERPKALTKKQKE
ncbi:CLUMA_CG016066, isoform A [Clunio marinus]|uniref:CLUMA_CG016066, isoform A n=1 Tax=Clunio marinus TaxID=568069 RepID=A0A1J1ISQ7_9DIPT|nr:CLUMA_CG016066, isoform A [Clunio marinus]